MTGGWGGDEPRSVGRVIAATFGLYRRYPLLFFVLAAAVVVPYSLILLATTGSGILTRDGLGAGVEFLLTAIDLALIGPLISALHVHAVDEVRRGGEPRLGAVARQGVAVLPVVAVASIVSGLGIGLGLVAFVVPGVILSLRWFVVAQAAAMEREGWRDALRSSARLTDGHYWRLFALYLFIGVFTMGPAVLLGMAFGSEDTVISFLVGLALVIFTYSFTALVSAVVYFDLRVRMQPSGLRAPSVSGVVEDGEEQGMVTPDVTRQSWDPRIYSDLERPKGWYVEPVSPGRMRYWAGGAAGWRGSTSTPRKVREEWLREVQADLGPGGG